MNDNNDSDTLPGLGSLAEQSVKNAISRGRKRRAHRPGVGTDEISIKPISALSPSELAHPDRQLPNATYHKKRRVTLIPTGDDESEEDSNDEWEEHIEVDRDRAQALVQSAEAKSKSDRDNTTDLDLTKKLQFENSHADATDETDKPESDQSSKKDEKSQHRRLAAAQRRKLLRRHTLHISLLISHIMRLDAAAQQDELRAVALSLAPVEIFKHNIALSERLSILALWARASFYSTAVPVAFHQDGSHLKFSRLCNAVERAIVTARDGAGDILDVLPIVAAIARSQYIRCRVVSALQPISHLSAKSAKGSNSVTGSTQNIQTSQIGESQSIMYGWLEVWSGDKWLAIDLVDGLVCGTNPSQVLRYSAEHIPTHPVGRGGLEQNYCESDKAVSTTGIRKGQSSKIRKRSSMTENISIREAPLRRSSRRLAQLQTGENIQENEPVQLQISKPVSTKPKLEACKRYRHLPSNFFGHVVAVECGMVTDVSRRYAKTWSEIDKARAGGKVFVKQIEAMGRPPTLKFELEAQRLERAEFDELGSWETIPATVSAVQKHPRYVLERHVKKYEVIYPKEPIVGYINDEPIYLRANVHLLHTRDRWIRQMCEVVADAKPLKAVRSKNGTDATVDLFGKWQTKPLVIPSVVEGKVPRGQHGNVDLWTSDHLPEGGAHVNMPYAKMAARRLGIDFAQAMTGFELRRGRSVPKIEGVVVPAENEQAVRDAACEIEAAAEKRMKDRARLEALQRWGKLLRTMKARETVRKKYGGLREGMTYEAKQKREGARKAFREKHGLSEMTSTENKDAASNTSKKKDGGKNCVESATHMHMYDRETKVDGDTWAKTCKVCGLNVMFEKL